ncbi:unnamed protein product [Penicillium salamii]|nr:unnamed protein product [Penicillium salamii]
MAIKKTSIASFPKNADSLVQPPQPLPLYKFIPLDEPPEDWIFLGVRYGRVEESRVLKSHQLRVLAKHYFWGIHWTENQKTAKTTRKAHNLHTFVKNLWKLFYYMQEEHRPKSWGDLINVERDSGPRLLRYDLSPRPPPLSRWFTTNPDDRTIILPAYSRPLNAPPDLPDLLLQQYLYSADSFHEPSVADVPVLPQTINAQYPYVGSTTDSISLTSEEQQDLALRDDLLRFLHSPGESPPVPEDRSPPSEEPLPKKRKRDISPSAPSYRGTAAPPAPAVPVFEGPVYASRHDPTEWTWMPGLQPEHFSPPDGEPQIGPLFSTTEPVYETEVVAEAVEKALMQVVYNDLERDPSVPSSAEPIKNITAHTFSDLLQMKIGAFNTIAKVRVSPLTFEWDPAGGAFPLRGRGPVWHADSCATDCVIMIGRLLEVGCTKIDRANNRVAGFTEIEKSYIETINMSWEILDENQSIRARDEFLQKFIDGQIHLRMGQPLPPWVVWSQVTRSFSQFRYHHIERVTPCKCQKAETFVDYHEGSCILPGYRRGDDRGVAVSTLIERCFYTRKSFACSQCGDPIGVTGERRIGQLPLRLVMTFDRKTRLRQHTRHLKFKYLDYEDKKQVAHYRWLGGVYNNEEHARVYWTDQKRGEKSGTDVMMYDSQLNQGLLLGAVPAFRPDDRVPMEWVNHNAIPLLFFERILNPSRELLATAHNAVYDMGNILGRNKNVLEEHVPWTTTDPQPLVEPWERVLSNVGDRFIDYNPDWGRVSTSPQPAASDLFPDPTLIDPTVIDQSTLDPSVYSSSSVPGFDILSFLNQDVMDEDFLAPQSPTGGLDRCKNHMFDSMLNTPDWLAVHPEMWPSGKPSKEGALEFPDLPTWPSHLGKRKRRTQSDATMPDADDCPPGDPPQPESSI